MNLYYIFVILYSLNTLSGVTSERCLLRGFTPRPTHQSCRWH